MPEFDVIFAGFPAKENFASFDDGREINEAAGKVFDLNPATLEIGEDLLHLGQRANPVIDGLAADVVALFGEAGEPFLVPLHFFAQAVELGELLAEPGQECPGFVAGVMLVKSVAHDRRRK